MEKIQITRFPDLQKDYHTQLGVQGEFADLTVAANAFRAALKRRGFKPMENGTWVRPGCAAVIVPRRQRRR